MRKLGGQHIRRTAPVVTGQRLQPLRTWLIVHRLGLGVNQNMLKGDARGRRPVQGGAAVLVPNSTLCCLPTLTESNIPAQCNALG